MRRHGVSSTSIPGVGYDSRRRVLEVQFRNGGLYRYRQVPVREYQALLEAPSIGAYMNRVIKPAYPYENLG